MFSNFCGLTEYLNSTSICTLYNVHDSYFALIFFLIPSFLQQLELSALKLEVDSNFPSELEAKRLSVLMYSNYM